MSAVVRVVLQPGQRLEVAYAEPPPPVVREALTLDEVAERHATTPRALRSLISKGKLPATKTGRAYTIRVEDAARVLAPTLRTPPSAKSPHDDSDEAIADRLRARGIRIGGVK